MKKLDGKVVIITGGGQGIGYGVATAFAKEGANLVLTGRTESKLINAQKNLEGSYGIKVLPVVADGGDENAVKKLFQIKQRPLNKPISLLVSNMEMVKLIAKDITEIEYKIMEEFFPGPLTIILKKKDIVPDIVTAGKDTVGIRMPSGEIARKLVELANVPIAAPSANISGDPSGTNLQEIMKDFEGKVDFAIDGGNSELGIGSTIMQVIDGKPKILRQGSITLEQINEVF